MPRSWRHCNSLQTNTTGALKGILRYEPSADCYTYLFRPCDLTIERMEACGITGGQRRGSLSAHASKRFSFAEVGMHLKGLFATKKLGLSTVLIWWSWLLIGKVSAVAHKCSMLTVQRPGLSALQCVSADLLENSWSCSRRAVSKRTMEKLCNRKSLLHTQPDFGWVHVPIQNFLGPQRNDGGVTTSVTDSAC